MNKSPLTRWLLGLLAASAVLSLVLLYLSVNDGTELRRLQPRVQAVNAHSMVVKSLLEDLFAYSRTNPSILPVVESSGIIKSNGPAPGSAAKPTGK